MIDRKTMLISGCVILALFASGLAGLAFFPSGQPVPVHYNAEGAADGWMPPLRAFFLSPAITALIWGFFLALRRMDTRRGDAARPMRAEGKMLYLGPLLMGVMQVYILSHAFGLKWGTPSIIIVAIGLFWMIQGNGMGKLRYDHPLGMRNPWTSSDPRVWDQAHRFGGWAMALAGAGAIVAGLAMPMGWPMMYVVLSLPIAAILTILVRSRLLWQRLHPGEPALPMNGGTLSMVVGLAVLTAIVADFALEQGRSGLTIALLSFLVILGLRYVCYRRQRR